jgi:hypothetical protein
MRASICRTPCVLGSDEFLRRLSSVFVGIWGDSEKVEVAASTELLLVTQAKPAIHPSAHPAEVVPSAAWLVRSAAAASRRAWAERLAQRLVASAAGVMCPRRTLLQCPSGVTTGSAWT